MPSLNLCSSQTALAYPVGFSRWWTWNTPAVGMQAQQARLKEGTKGKPMYRIWDTKQPSLSPNWLPHSLPLVKSFSHWYELTKFNISILTCHMPILMYYCITSTPQVSSVSNYSMALLSPCTDNTVFLAGSTSSVFSMECLEQLCLWSSPWLTCGWAVVGLCVYGNINFENIVCDKNAVLLCFRIWS